MAHWCLQSLDISGGFLSDLRLTLPQGLICVIGPRGSGKSTLAEAFRLALAGIPQGAPKDRLAFIKANLGTSLITIATSPSVERGTYTIRRSYGQPPVLTAADGRPVAGVDLDRGSFLPLDAYSSLEIEAIAQESLGDKRRLLLDDLCAADMQQIQLDLGDHRRKLESNADTIHAMLRRIADLTEQIEELGDVQGKLEALPQVSAIAASPEFQTASQQRSINEQETIYLRSASEVITQLRTALTSAIASAKRKFPSPAMPNPQNSPLLEKVDTAAKQLWTSVDGAALTIMTAIDAAEHDLKGIADAMHLAHSQHEATYAKLQQQNQEAVRALEARAATQREVASLDRLTKERTDAQSELRTLHAQRAEMKADYLLSRDRISDLREKMCIQLQQEAGKKVLIRVHRNADSSEYKQQLLSALSGSGTKNQDEIVTTLAALPPEQLAQLIRENDIEELDAQASFGPERARKIMAALQGKLNPLLLEVMAIDDRISIELNVGNEMEPNFKDAAELSRGQKCTAILPILLARRFSPLVIDQPEDNLDNHFIYETVVDSIRRLKTRRQMIFITHNANIPVLGEAELVIVLNSDGKRGFVEKAGTVDECRKEIIDLLEGGEEAFQLRRRRYGS